VPRQLHPAGSDARPIFRSRLGRSAQGDARCLGGIHAGQMLSCSILFGTTWSAIRGERSVTGGHSGRRRGQVAWHSKSWSGAQRRARHPQRRSGHSSPCGQELQSAAAGARYLGPRSVSTTPPPTPRIMRSPPLYRIEHQEYAGMMTNPVAASHKDSSAICRISRMRKYRCRSSTD